MRSVRFLIAAGAASLMSSAAFAADMPIMPPPPPVYAPPPVDFGGWYLRGDIGMTNQSLKSLTNTDPNSAAFTSTGMGFDSSMLWDVGVGYQFNNWFRVDVTGQYRGKSNFHGSQYAPAGVFGPTFAENDNYSGSKSETVIMANAYVDLGTWWCVTPFIGAGVGMARVTIADYTDTGSVNNNGAGFGAFPSFASAPAASKWNFAWALHTGLAYRVNPGLTLELAYSYVNLGSGTTGAVSDYTGFTRGVPMQFHDITSHDVKLGVRWDLNSPPAYAPPPLITKG